MSFLKRQTPLESYITSPQKSLDKMVKFPRQLRKEKNHSSNRYANEKSWGWNFDARTKA